MEMLLFVIIAIVLSPSAAEDPLRAVLRSPRASVKLYSDYKTAQHLAYTNRAENSMRFRLFLDSARHVADYNEDNEDTAHYAINKFSVMSEDEKRAYHGLNVTETQAEDGEMIPELEVRGSANQESFLWTDMDAVTVAQDQGGCGSCWAFAGVAALETWYQKESGVLRRFSEQEILDCAYEATPSWDGCDGGGIGALFLWSKRTGRLATAEDRPYEHRDRRCRASKTPNGLKATKIVGNGFVDKTEDAHVRKLQDGAIAVSFFVTSKFHQYEYDIMRDTTCSMTDVSNHGVAMVGYTTRYFLLKNSWGRDWGEEGFSRLSRNHHNCNLYKNSRYPIMRSTGGSDTGSDTPAFHIPKTCEEDDVYADYCSTVFLESGCCGDCTGTVDAPRKLMRRLREEICPGTCSPSTCEDGGEGRRCPAGTVRCGDGVCRHQHMCH